MKFPRKAPLKIRKTSYLSLARRNSSDNCSLCKLLNREASTIKKNPNYKTTLLTALLQFLFNSNEK